MISVVICTYNRAALLRRTLTSFFAQECLDEFRYELLIVDNNSNDETRAVAEAFTHHNNVRYIFESNQGLSRARNRGIDESNGEIVAFIDDDVELDPNWIVNLRRCFDETDADVVGGRTWLIFETDPPDWLGPYFRTHLSECDNGRERHVIDKDEHLFGLNLAFRKAVLVESGRFDESLGRSGNSLAGGEDSEIVRRVVNAGGKAIYDPDAALGHIIEPQRMQWSYFRRIALRMGRALALMDENDAFGHRLNLAMRSLVAVPLVVWRWLRTAVSMRDAYRRAVARDRIYQEIGRTSGRWRRLFSP